MFEGGSNEEEQLKPITIKEDEPVKLDVIEINTEDVKVDKNDLFEDELLDNNKEINETLTILTDLGDKSEKTDESIETNEEESSDSIKKII